MKKPLLSHQVYDQESFYDVFIEDLKAARARVLIHSPFVSAQKLQRLSRTIATLDQRGVQLCVFIQELGPLQTEEQRIRARVLNANIQSLQSLGAHVSQRPRIHAKLAVIDDDILWDGSLNILSHFDSKERMTRWLAKSMVDSAIVEQELNSCDHCSPFARLCFSGLDDKDNQYRLTVIGSTISKRRMTLGMSQHALARLAKVDQRTISEIENGRRNTTFTMLATICKCLEFDLIAVPSFFVPSIDRQISKSNRQPRLPDVR